MGHDSCNDEQRRPYLRANAGRAFADWLLLRIRKTTTKAPVARVCTHGTFPQRRDCVPIRMPDSLRQFFLKAASHNARQDHSTRACEPLSHAAFAQDRSENLLSGGPTTVPGRNPTMAPQKLARAI